MAAALRFTSGDRTTWYNWTGPRNGFVRLPDAQPGGTGGFFLDAYVFRLEAPELPGATVQELWSQRLPDEFWPIHRVDWQDKTYHFQRMHSFDGARYRTVDVEVPGADRPLLQIQSQNVMRGGTSNNDVRLDQANC